MGIRDYKSFAPGEYYHVYNRGVGKMSIFKDEQDFRIFLSRLQENIFPNRQISLEDAHQGGQTKNHTPYIRKILPEDAFSLISYCLMPNHFHILIRQNNDTPISKLISKVCTSYSKYFNKKYDRVGALFQDQFKCQIINKNEYLLWLSVYIHLNPKVARLVKNSSSWKWSSYLEYLGLDGNNLCEKGIILEQTTNSKSYQNMVEYSFGAIVSKKYPMVDILDPEFESP
ncbi:MAG: transposase [Patescibacteria group bacterium]